LGTVLDLENDPQFRLAQRLVSLPYRLATDPVRGASVGREFGIPFPVDRANPFLYLVFNDRSRPFSRTQIRELFAPLLVRRSAGADIVVEIVELSGLRLHDG